MNDIKNACKKIVVENIKDDVCDELIELLTISVMAIFLGLEELALQKLPVIFKELNIYAEDKSVLEISHDRLGNYSEDESLINADASATRALHVDDETGAITDCKNLVISLTDIERKNPINMIEKITNCLIHLMRFGEIKDSHTYLYISDGLSLATYNKNNGSLKRKHLHLEEGIVQYFTIRFLENLADFVETEDVDDNYYLSEFKHNFDEYSFSNYSVQTSIIEMLCEDRQFKELLLLSFTEATTPSSLSVYFNAIMKNSTAFTLFSKQIDNCYNAIFSGDEVAAKDGIDIIKRIIQQFQVNAKRYVK